MKSKMTANVPETENDDTTIHTNLIDLELSSDVSDL